MQETLFVFLGNVAVTSRKIVSQPQHFRAFLLFSTTNKSVRSIRQKFFAAMKITVQMGSKYVTE